MKTQRQIFLFPLVTQCLAILTLLTIALLTITRAATAVESDTGTISPPPGSADPLDWPNWRGPWQNGTGLMGTGSETDLVDRWDPRGGEGSNVLWKSAELAGRSTPIVMRDKLYTIVLADPETPDEGEKVVCVDAATGSKIWENRFNVYLSDVPDTRVGWSSCVGDPATGHVYALGVCGYFQCLDGKTGETIWSHSLHEQYGFLSTYGGRTNVPVVFDDLVIISAVVIGWGDTPATGLMAKPAHRFMAFDKASGQMVWFNGTRLIPYDTTYSTPTLTRLGGQWAMVFGSGDGQVWAMQPRTGQPIWHFPLSRRGLNVSPLVDGDMIYMSHSEENIKGTRMGALVAFRGNASGDLSGEELRKLKDVMDAGKSSPVIIDTRLYVFDDPGKPLIFDRLWKLEEIMAGKSSPMILDGRLYVFDDRGKLLIFDSKTGNQITRKALGTVMRSSPLYADGKIYVCTANGRWYILKPTEAGVEVVSRGRLPRGEESHGSPIVSHGRIYIPTTGHLYCIGVEDSDAQTSEIIIHDLYFGFRKDADSQQTIDATDPAHVQVVPCEVLLEPGETQKFTVRLFDARGEFIKESPATFSLSGPGTITDDGMYTAPTGSDHTATIVAAKVGDLEARARLRVAPPLPWRYDFNDADDVPLSWVGGRVRYVLRDVVGERIMVKRDELPTRPGQKPTKLGTKSRMWMGQVDLSNYTIQADVQGQIKDGKMPDVGLINQRYTLSLQGAGQKVHLRSWAASEYRASALVAFDWKPNVWYIMKLTTTVVDGKAHVRGKVWPRDADEPQQWTAEIMDNSPNLQGSPGLYGNARDAEIFLDNITVTPN